MRTQGGGGSKIGRILRTSFMDGPLDISMALVPEFEDPDFMKYLIFIIQRFPDNVSFDFNNFIQALNNF